MIDDESRNRELAYATFVSKTREIVDERFSQINVAYGFCLGIAQLMNASTKHLAFAVNTEADINRYAKELFLHPEKTFPIIRESGKALVTWQLQHDRAEVILRSSNEGFLPRLNATAVIKAEYGKTGKEYTCIVDCKPDQGEGHTDGIENILVCKYTKEGVTVTRLLPPYQRSKTGHNWSAKALEYSYEWSTNGHSLNRAKLTSVSVGDIEIPFSSGIVHLRDPYSWLVDSSQSAGTQFMKMDTVRIPSKVHIEPYNVPLWRWGSTYVIQEPDPDVLDVMANDLPWLKRLQISFGGMVTKVPRHKPLLQCNIPAFVTCPVGHTMSDRLFQQSDVIQGQDFILLDENATNTFVAFSKQLFVQVKPYGK